YTGAGILGACFVGFTIGVLTLVAGRAVIKNSRSPVIRTIILILFVVPAFWAGDLVRWLEVPSVAWQYVYAVFGAFTVGGTAFARLTDPDPPEWLRPDDDWH